LVSRKTFLTKQLDQPVLDGLGLVPWRGKNLADGAFARFGVDQDEVRERASDVDTHAIVSLRGQALHPRSSKRFRERAT
jgi:hypothetical protein